MNKVILIGRLTKDPELRTTQSGTATTSFTVAVDRTFVNQQTGQREADFINCVAFRSTADFVNKFFKKGSLISLDGRIQTRNYDAQDGTKRYVTEVICDNVTFLGSKNSSRDDSSNYSEPSDDIETTNLEEDPYANMGDEVALTDDDLPFDFN